MVLGAWLAAILVALTGCAVCGEGSVRGADGACYALIGPDGERDGVTLGGDGDDDDDDDDEEEEEEEEDD
jgi:hypothetical protein